MQVFEITWILYKWDSWIYLKFVPKFFDVTIRAAYFYLQTYIYLVFKVIFLLFHLKA